MATVGQAGRKQTSQASKGENQLRGQNAMQVPQHQVALRQGVREQPDLPDLQLRSRGEICQLIAVQEENVPVGIRTELHVLPLCWIRAVRKLILS
jgi:hypothetical protein